MLSFPFELVEHVSRNSTREGALQHEKTSSRDGRRCSRSAPWRRVGAEGNPILARHGRAAWRRNQCARRRIQQEPDRVQSRVGLQGLVHRDADCCDRGFSRQAEPPHRPGVRGRHRHDDGGQGRGLSRVSVDGRQRRGVRPQGLYRPRLRLLLHDRRQAAVDAVQLLDPRVLLEQGTLPEGRPRSQQAADDLAGGGRDGQETRRLRRALRHHDPVADLDDDRELRRLAQSALLDQGQRFWRSRHRAEIQRSAARQAHQHPGRVVEGQGVRLRRSRGQIDSALHRRRVCHAHRLLGLGAAPSRRRSRRSRLASA